MDSTTVAVGSLGALRWVLTDGLLPLGAGADVVVVPTAAAFVGIAEAAGAVAEVCEPFELRVEALMVADRASTGEPYFAERLAGADLVVLCDGSPLHARAVWRATPVGEGIERARRLLAIGSVASVLGGVMIDPRGGAPTTGLGYREGVAFATASSDEQLARTRSLMPRDLALVVLGPLGVVAGEGARWRVVQDDVVVTRGLEPASL